MRKAGKPVRKCGKCLLNLGDHCWGFRQPRDQWRRGQCVAFANEGAYAMFREWRDECAVKTRRQIRQEAFPKRRERRHAARLEGKRRQLK